MDISISGNRGFQAITPYQQTRHASQTTAAGVRAVSSESTRTSSAQAASVSTKLEPQQLTQNVSQAQNQSQPLDPTVQARGTEQALQQLKDTAIPTEVQLQFRRLTAQNAAAQTAASAYMQTQQAAEQYPRQIDTVV